MYVANSSGSSPALRRLASNSAASQSRSRASGARAASAAIAARISRRPVQPPLRDRLPQRRLRTEVPVDAAVADAERAGHVDHGGLGRAVAAQHLLGRLEDALGGQGLGWSVPWLDRTRQAGSALAVEVRHLRAPGSARRRPRPPGRPPRSRRGRGVEGRRPARPATPSSRSRVRAPTSGTMSSPRGEHPGDGDLRDA